MRSFLAAAGIALLASTVWAQDITATRTLRVGETVALGDLRPSGNDEVDADIGQMVGLEVRRSIFNGRPVNLADLGPPTLVERNAIVVMTYARRGLGIRTEGRALDAGGMGEDIRVMNMSSRTPVRATVSGPNRVEVLR